MNVSTFNPPIGLHDKGNRWSAKHAKQREKRTKAFRERVSRPDYEGYKSHGAVRVGREGEKKPLGNRGEQKTALCKKSSQRASPRRKIRPC